MPQSPSSTQPPNAGTTSSNQDSFLDERRAALDAVLVSREFSRAPALAKLLKYLCEKTFEGRVHEIKEYSIATDVFGRSETFGEKRDSVVRVEVSRLRKRLGNYYAVEGARQPLRICIPAGTYRPEFEPAAPLPDVGGALAEITPLPSPAHSWVGWVIAAFILLAVSGAAVSYRVRHSAVRTVPSGITPTAAPAPTGDIPRPVRILAGSSIPKSVDRFGAEWMGDRYFIGGEQNHWQFGGKEMGVPVRTIRWAPDQLYFRSFRFGTFSYKIPLPAGKYDLKLYFSEVIFLPTEFDDGVENRRIFDVSLNGRSLLSAFDIAADAGGANTADIRAFSGVSPVNGFLTLNFNPVLSGAWLNAFEIIPNATGRPLPIRVFTRNANFTDHAGNLWEFDHYFSGGRLISDGEAVTGTQDPEQFLSQRYGNFTYRFPVAPGKYALRLLFAETFFGPHNRGRGGPGSRVFNVTANGSTLLNHFEIFKEAGERHAIEKVFHGLHPNSQGRIDVTFEPVVQYAAVNALEVTAEN